MISGNTNHATKTRRLKTANIETLKFKVEQPIPEGYAQDDTDHHTKIRKLRKQTIEITDDREFSRKKSRR